MDSMSANDGFYFVGFGNDLIFAWVKFCSTIFDDRLGQFEQISLNLTLSLINEVQGVKKN